MPSSSSLGSTPIRRSRMAVYCFFACSELGSLLYQPLTIAWSATILFHASDLDPARGLNLDSRFCASVEGDISTTRVAGSTGFLFILSRNLDSLSVILC